MPLSLEHENLVSSISDPSTHAALSEALCKGAPRARLALANAVSRAAQVSGSPETLPAWRLAIICFKDLTPALAVSKGNGVSGSASRVLVETYAALYSLAVTDQAAHGSTEAIDAQGIAADAMRTIMATPSEAHSRRGRGSSVQEATSRKTEADRDAEFLDRVIFPGASALGWNRLLPASSGNGTAVVVPALLARIRGADAPLCERTMVARVLLVPWIKFMETAAQAKAADARQATAYTRKARASLLHAAEGKQHRPISAFRARIAAATLFTHEPVEFARTVHRAANTFLRSKKARDYNTVAELYCQAMDSFRQILTTVRPLEVHESEEVSAWFDHFYVSCFTSGDERFRRKAISAAVFRSETLAASSFFGVIDSQRILVQGGLYVPDTDLWTGISTTVDAIVQNVALLFEGKQSEKSKARVSLRFLRVFETLRSVLSSSQASTRSLDDSKRFLQCYVRMFTFAVQCLASEKTVVCSPADVALQNRVNALSGAALSACEALIRLGAKSCVSESLTWPAKKCVSIIIATGKDISQWAKWLAVLLNNTGIDLYNRHVKCVTPVDSEMMKQAGWLMELSAKWLALSSQSRPCIEDMSFDCSVFPEVSKADVLRCSKRLAFAADSFLGSGEENLYDALRVASIGLICCVTNGVSPLPPEISVSFARTAADFAELRCGFVSTVLKPLLGSCSLSSAVDSALEAVRKYRVDFYRKLPRSEVTRIEPLTREVGLLRLQSELFECAVSSSKRTSAVEFEFQKARLDVLFEKGNDSDFARYLCSRKDVSNSLTVGSKSASRRGARGNGVIRSRRNDISCENVSVYVLLAALWDATEHLNFALIEDTLLKLEERVSGTLRVGATARGNSNLCELALFDILEMVEWCAFALAGQDFDELAVRVQELCRRVSADLGIPYCKFDVADTYRRLGLTRYCWSLLQKDESAGHRECIAVHARVLNDLGRYSDTEVVTEAVGDARAVGAGADAALSGRGDVRLAMARTKAAMKTLVRALAPISSSMKVDSPSTFQVAGVTVCLSTTQSQVSSLFLVYNRSRVSLLIELALCLARMAIIYDRLDNVRDAQYYADKSAELSVHLLSPSIELFCKDICERIPCVLTDAHPSPPATGSHSSFSCDSDALNALTAARFLVGSVSRFSQYWTSAETIHPDTIREILAAIDLAKENLEKLENSSDVDEDILSPVFAGLVVSRGQCLLLGGSFAESMETFQLALQASNLNPKCRLEAIVGMAKCQLHLRKTVASVATLKTAKCTVSENRIAFPRLLKHLHHLFAEAKLSLHPFALIGDSAVINGLAEGHGASVGLRRAVLRVCSKNVNSSAEDGMSSLEKQFQSFGVTETTISRLRSKMASRNVLVGFSLSSEKDAIFLWQVSVSREPFALRLPIPVEGLQSYQSIQQRLNEILASMKAMTTGEGVLSEREKKRWWKKRFELDHSLGQLMADVEEHWLGDARALFLPVSFHDDFGVECDPVVSAFGAAAIHHPDLISADAIASVVDRANPEMDSQPFVRRVQELLDEASSSQKIASPRRRQKTQTRQSSRSQVPKVQSAKSITVAGEVMLAIDTDLEFLPWECLPVLRSSKCGVSRLPHESFLSPCSDTDIVDSSRVFYVLNPTGDLASTQRTFQDLFESQYGWSGTSGSSGRKLDTGDNLASLESNDVFLYCGHGGGESIVPPRQLATSLSRVPVSILMGCSSGRLERYSSGAESGGTAVEYLLAGAPAVVANMWDVSDKDIDRLTESLLEHWMGISVAADKEVSQGASATGSKTCTLAVALARARDACRLPYLVGAATVLYGNGMIKCSE